MRVNPAAVDLGGKMMKHLVKVGLLVAAFVALLGLVYVSQPAGAADGVADEAATARGNDLVAPVFVAEAEEDEEDEDFGDEGFGGGGGDEDEGDEDEEDQAPEDPDDEQRDDEDEDEEDQEQRSPSEPFFARS